MKSSKFIHHLAATLFYFVISFVQSKGSAGSISGGPRLAGGYVVGIRGGLGSDGFYFNLTASFGLRYGTSDFNVNGMLSGSFYPGSQLGTAIGARPSGYDITGGAYLMAGTGSGVPRHFYTLNYNTPSPFPDVTDHSIAWGQLITYNYTINALGTGPGLQTQGIFGLRLGNGLMISYHNDSKLFPTFAGILRGPLNILNTDAGWTGGLTMNIYDVEIVYENYSGYRYVLDPNAPLPVHYPQSPYDQLMNKASTFIQYDGFRLGNIARNSGFRFDYFTAAWFQNFIHNKISCEPRYLYTFLNKFNAGAGGSRYSR